MEATPQTKAEPRIPDVPGPADSVAPAPTIAWGGAAGPSMTPSAVTSLQRNAGNHAVAAVLERRARPPRGAAVDHVGRATLARSLRVPAEPTDRAVQAALARSAQARVMREAAATDLVPDWILDGVRSRGPRDPRLHALTAVVGTDPLTDEPRPHRPRGADRDAAHLRAVRRGGRPGPAGDRRPRRHLRLHLRGLAAHDLTLARIERDIGAAWDELSVTERDRRQRRDRRALRRRAPADVARVRRARSSTASRDGPRGRRRRRRAAARRRPRSRRSGTWRRRSCTTTRCAARRSTRRRSRSSPTSCASSARSERLAQMEERGTLQETADWLDTQLGDVQRPARRARRALRRRVGGDPAGEPARTCSTNLAGARRSGRSALVQRVGDFAGDVIAEGPRAGQGRAARLAQRARRTRSRASTC